jgi:hypothetical protein
MDAPTNPVDHDRQVSERLGGLIADMNGVAGCLDGPTAAWRLRSAALPGRIGSSALVASRRQKAESQESLEVTK